MSIKDKLNRNKNINNEQTPNENPIPEFYANAILVNSSAFEFELQHLLVDSQKRVKGALNIRLSPQTAYMLARALEGQLNLYEKTNGEIALPSELKKKVK